MMILRGGAAIGINFGKKEVNAASSVRKAPLRAGRAHKKGSFLLGKKKMPPSGLSAAAAAAVAVMETDHGRRDRSFLLAAVVYSEKSLHGGEGGGRKPLEILSSFPLLGRNKNAGVFLSRASC